MSEQLPTWPCDTCKQFGRRYRCYDGPLECPRFCRWVDGYEVGEAKPRRLDGKQAEYGSEVQP